MSKNNIEENFLYVEDINEHGYGTFPKALSIDTRITPEAKAIYAYITSYAGSGRTAFPGVDIMIHHLNMSRRRFYAHRAYLVAYGYLKITQTYKKNDNNKIERRNNIYTLCSKPVEIPELVAELSKSSSSKSPKRNVKSPKNDEELQNVTVHSDKGNDEQLQNVTVQNVTVQNVTENNNSINNNSINNNSIISSSSNSLVDNLLEQCEKRRIKLSRSDIETLMTLYEPIIVARAINKLIWVASGKVIKCPRTYIQTILDNNVKPNQVVVNKTGNKGTFNDYEQRTYDFDDLERKLLGWDNDNLKG